MKVESSHCRYVHVYDGYVKAFYEAIVFDCYVTDSLRRLLGISGFRPRNHTG